MYKHLSHRRLLILQRDLMLLHRWKVCLKWVISIGGTCRNGSCRMEVLDLLQAIYTG